MVIDFSVQVYDGCSLASKPWRAVVPALTLGRCRRADRDGLRGNARVRSRVHGRFAEAPGRSGGSPVLADAPHPHLSERDRHIAAVARSLGWARESAARGDYADALAWVQVVEAIGDPIPREYETKRQAWLAALDESRAR